MGTVPYGWGRLVVVVPASACLSAQAAGGDHSGLEWVRLPAWLAERQLHERLGDRVAHVDPDQVHQLERAHSVAAADLVDAVDLLDGREALLEQPERFASERAAAAVHQEAGAITCVDHALAHRLACCSCGRERLL